MVFAGRQYFLGDKCQVGQNVTSGLNVNKLQIGMPFFFLLSHLFWKKKHSYYWFFYNVWNHLMSLQPLSCSWFCFPGPLRSKREVLQCLYSRSRDSDHCGDSVHWGTWGKVSCPSILSHRQTSLRIFKHPLWCFRHLVPLTNLKPGNPVPAWNITPSRKGNSYNHREQYSSREIGLTLQQPSFLFNLVDRYLFCVIKCLCI